MLQGPLQTGYGPYQPDRPWVSSETPTRQGSWRMLLGEGEA